MVSPLDDSTHSPPMNCFTWVTETLTWRPPSRASESDFSLTLTQFR
jgi:hypothetical protein